MVWQKLCVAVESLVRVHHLFVDLNQREEYAIWREDGTGQAALHARQRYSTTIHLSVSLPSTSVTQCIYLSFSVLPFIPSVCWYDPTPTTIQICLDVIFPQAREKVILEKIGLNRKSSLYECDTYVNSRTHMKGNKKINGSAGRQKDTLKLLAETDTGGLSCDQNQYAQQNLLKKTDT